MLARQIALKTAYFFLFLWFKKESKEIGNGNLVEV